MSSNLLWLMSTGSSAPPPSTDGGLFATGSNTGGELGIGNLIDQSSLTQVGADSTWEDIAIARRVGAGPRGVAGIKNNALYTWGEAVFGMNGRGNTTNSSSPIQVGALTDWEAVTGGNNTFLSIKTDGTLWSWGSGSLGCLGTGSTADTSSPVQVGALTTWSEVAAGMDSVVSVRLDGTLWTWGQNFYGSLGTGTSTQNRSSPVQVGALGNWVQVTTGGSSCFAIKTDGTLWAWGRGSNGCLGTGGSVNRSSPVQVGALTDWAFVDAGRPASNTYCHAVAIKTDKTLWTWGKGSNGQLGLGTAADQTSPVQVGSNADWVFAFGGSECTFMVNEAGELWATGSNGDGELGLGNTTNYSSPVQVGTFPNFLSGDSVAATTFIIK